MQASSALDCFRPVFTTPAYIRALQVYLCVYPLGTSCQHGSPWQLRADAVPVLQRMSARPRLKGVCGRHEAMRLHSGNDLECMESDKYLTSSTGRPNHKGHAMLLWQSSTAAAVQRRRWTGSDGAQKLGTLAFLGSMPSGLTRRARSSRATRRACWAPAWTSCCATSPRCAPPACSWCSPSSARSRASAGSPAPSRCALPWADWMHDYVCFSLYMKGGSQSQQQSNCRVLLVRIC